MYIRSKETFVTDFVSMESIKKIYFHSPYCLDLRQPLKNILFTFIVKVSL